MWWLNWFQIYFDFGDWKPCYLIDDLISFGLLFYHCDYKPCYFMWWFDQFQFYFDVIIRNHVILCG